MKTLFTQIATSVLILVFGLFVVSPAYAGETAAGLQAVAAGTGLNEVGSVNTAIGNVIGVALAFSGILFFGLSLYGGITWMTAAGNQENVRKGLKILLTAIAGLLVVLSAYAITSFVFENTGTQVQDTSQSPAGSAAGTSAGGRGTPQRYCCAFVDTSSRIVPGQEMFLYPDESPTDRCLQICSNYNGGNCPITPSPTLIPPGGTCQ